MADDELEGRLSGLMNSAQAGDGSAYEELLRLSLPLIVRIVKSQNRARLDVEDIVQNVLLSLHSVRHTYDRKRPFIPWLSSIAHHRTIDAYRRAARIAQNESNVAELPETISDARTNGNTECQGDPKLLHQAIAELPIRQRQAVELLKLKEFSLKEASAASGMSIAALKVAVHRGLKSLRSRLIGEAVSTNELE